MGDRVHVVLGATGGIGGEVCRRLRRRDEVVHLVARGEGKLVALGQELGCDWTALDATDVKAVEEVVRRVAEHHGRLDGLVNCVGSILLKPAHLTTAEEWTRCLHTNTTTAFATVRAAGKTMRKDGGSVVLMSSAVGRIGLQNHEAIAAAKAGVEGLARSAAATYASSGIRVNAVAPGLVRTPLSERITSNPAGEEASRSMHALGRLGEPGDVASLVAWLLREDNDWITGQVLGVDGGLGTVHLRS
jgi:NAD(P)-dependent dehydrogenase (short-subunit alcohol dehydrogenase family)